VADCPVLMVGFFGGDDQVVNEDLGGAMWFYTDDSLKIFT